MKKLNLFLLVAGFFVFSSCTERLEHNEEKSSGNVVINLSSVNAERGAVPTGYESVDSSKVTEWKLTFSPVSPYNDFPDEVRTIEKTINGTYSVTIGVGKYDLFVEGSYTEPGDNGGFIYNLSGTRSGIVIEEGRTETVSVLVGPRKTTEGKGRFSATMFFGQAELADYYKKVSILDTSTPDEKSKRFKAELVSRKTGEIVYSTHSVDNVDKLLVAEADSEDTSITVKSDQAESGLNKIPSGYYYFRFYADFAPLKPNDPSAEITPDWKELFIGNNLVEIGDGLLTPMTCESLSFPDESTTYCYYASDKGSKENNGISEDAPGELYAVLDTIYNNPMVQNAEINYSYTDSIRFDVSKIRSGKKVEIICRKNGKGEATTFVLEADSSMYFQNLMESITLTSTGDAKSVKIKESSSAFVYSGNAQKAGISLEKGVYLDLTSLTTGESIKSVNLYLDVDDIEYYKKNPVFVSSVSLLEKNAIDNSENDDIIRFAGDGQFNFIFSEKKISSERFEYFADSPVVGVMYSHENAISGYEGYIFSLYNATFDYSSTPVEISKNIGVSAWCSDKNGNIYAAAFNVDNKKPSSAPYFIKYEKQVKGASFDIVKKSLGYSVENLPASMCTDGKSIWYVNSAAKINLADTSDSFSLFDAGSWVSSDSKVYKVSIESPTAQEPLDFSALFKNGKVTAVYYCDGALYVAGFKSELKAKYKWLEYGKNDESVHDIWNRTFSVYKFAEPDNITSEALVSAVPVSDVYTDEAELKRRKEELDKLGDVRVRSYSSITDMAVVGGKVYVLENTYMTIQSDDGYWNSTTSVTGTLRNITDNKIYDKYTYTDYNSQKQEADFVLPGKILAVVPKKLKLVLCDSEKGKNYYYDVDLSHADNVSIERKDVGSAYCFDSFPTASALGKTFDDNSVYIKQSSNDTPVSE